MMFKGSFREISRQFQGNFKGVSRQTVGGCKKDCMVF